MYNHYLNIYLDASSTTPPHREVIEEIQRSQLYNWANPYSLHQKGLKAAEELERCRVNVASKFSIKPDQVVFTSGATESINLAIKRCTSLCSNGRLVISQVEHPSVINVAKSLNNTGWDCKYWPVDKYGIIQLDRADDLLNPPTKLVSLIWGQSEIGSLQPIKTVAKICRANNIILHTDATQVISQGVFDFNDLDVDLLSASAHKFQGPKGIGILLVSEHLIDKIKADVSLSIQENGIRAGTPAVSLISGLSKSIEKLNNIITFRNDSPEFQASPTIEMTSNLRSSFENWHNIIFTGHPNNRLPNHISFLLANSQGEPLEAREIIRKLSDKGVYASSGTACSSGQLHGSHVLSAINVPEPFQKSSIRFSLGPWLTNQQVELVPSILKEVID